MIPIAFWVSGGTRAPSTTMWGIRVSRSGASEAMGWLHPSIVKLDADKYGRGDSIRITICVGL